MNASKRYLPLSVVLLLAASTNAANAGSALDPYAHIKAPVVTKKKAAPAPVQTDDVTAPHTYVTMQYAKDEEDKKKGGLLGNITAPFKAVGAGAAKSGQFIVSGARASGDMAKKSVGMVGSGAKTAGDKIKDSSDAVSNKIADKPKKDSANKQASVDDWYANAAARRISTGDDGTRAKNLLKTDPSKNSGKQTAFLPTAGGGGGNKLSKLNPFSKLAKKKGDDRADMFGPPSGFADGAYNPDEEVLAEKQRIKAEKEAIAKKQKIEQAPITPEMIRKQEEREQQVAASTTVNKPAKKSKLGGFGLASLKPQLPGLPFKKKPAANNKAVAAAPKVKAAPPVKKVDEDIEAAIARGAEPEDLAPTKGTEIPSNAQPSMAFNTGDKEIDAVAPKAPRATTGGAVAAVKPDAKKGKFLGLSSAMKIGVPKFNFLNKKKPAPSQTATKADAPKQM